MTHDTLVVLLSSLGHLVGVGAGSYFGLKSALNGMREDLRRIDRTATELRDHVRDAHHDLREHRKEAERFVTELRGDIAHAQGRP